MIRNTLQSFALAYRNIRSNLFHTFLSVLGIVIGVAALVATLSLIDGLEMLARKRISAKTSMNSIVVSTETEKLINNLSVRKDSFQVIDYEHFMRLRGSNMPLVEKCNLQSTFNREIKVEGRDSAIGAMINCFGETPFADSAIINGKNLPASAFSGQEAVAVVNAQLAKLITGSDDPGLAVGTEFQALDLRFRIIGISKDSKKETPPQACIPISLLSRDMLHRSPPNLLLKVARTEEVPPLKTQIDAWLKNEYGDQSRDFLVQSQDFWIDEAMKMFVAFRIIMGLIIGLSVIVGGVGVMNVLLISVTERTAEIGLRKAIGAKKGDINRLFLAESITISAFGSALGLIIGAGFAKVAAPVISYLIKIPFQAVLTWNTFITIGLVAVFIGIVFGTYPAIKAARMNPVDALRRE